MISKKPGNAMNLLSGFYFLMMGILPALPNPNPQRPLQRKSHPQTGFLTATGSSFRLTDKPAFTCKAQSAASGPNELTRIVPIPGGSSEARDWFRPARHVTEQAPQYHIYLLLSPAAIRNWEKAES